MEQLSTTELKRLTPHERLALITQLWDSLDEGEILLSDAQSVELDHRLATLEQDRLGRISWLELKSELEKRCA